MITPQRQRNQTIRAFLFEDACRCDLDAASARYASALHPVEERQARRALDRAIRRWLRAVQRTRRAHLQQPLLATRH